MKKIIVTLVLVCLAQVNFAQDKPTKEDVLKVIAKSGSSGQLEAGKKQILGMIPQEKHAMFLIDFDAIISKINDKTAEIYMQEYTKEDIKAMLAFYESPVGKKMAEKSEVLATKSQEVMIEVQTQIQEVVTKYMQ